MSKHSNGTPGKKRPRHHSKSGEARRLWSKDQAPIRLNSRRSVGPIGPNLIGVGNQSSTARAGVEIHPQRSSLDAVLYGKLLVVKETNVVGDVIERERRTTVNHAMKTCRRAWNVADRRNPGKITYQESVRGDGAGVVR